MFGMTQEKAENMEIDHKEDIATHLEDAVHDKEALRTIVDDEIANLKMVAQREILLLKDSLKREQAYIRRLHDEYEMVPKDEHAELIGHALMEVKSKTEMDDMTEQRIAERQHQHASGEARIIMEITQLQDLKQAIINETEMQAQQADAIDVLKTTLGNSTLDVQNAQKDAAVSEGETGDLQRALYEAQQETAAARRELANIRAEIAEYERERDMMIMDMQRLKMQMASSQASETERMELMNEVAALKHQVISVNLVNAEKQRKLEQWLRDENMAPDPAIYRYKTKAKKSEWADDPPPPNQHSAISRWDYH